MWQAVSHRPAAARVPAGTKVGRVLLIGTCPARRPWYTGCIDVVVTAETLAELTRELRHHLRLGDFAAVGRTTLGDGIMVVAESMARIVLADLESIIRDGSNTRMPEHERTDLHAAALRLLALVTAPVRA